MRSDMIKRDSSETNSAIITTLDRSEKSSMAQSASYLSTHKRNRMHSDENDKPRTDDWSPVLKVIARDRDRQAFARLFDHFCTQNQILRHDAQVSAYFGPDGRRVGARTS